MAMRFVSEGCCSGGLVAVHFVATVLWRYFFVRSDGFLWVYVFVRSDGFLRLSVL